MFSISKRSAPVAKPISLTTEELVEHMSAQLRKYSAASDDKGRQTAVETAWHIFAQFESSKSDAVAVHPQHRGAGLKPAKLESLARKLAATPNYSVADARAFFKLVSPPLADRLGVVSALSVELGLAAEERTTAQLALTEATQQAAALVQDAEGALLGVRGKIDKLLQVHDTLLKECEAIKTARANLRSDISDGGALFTTGGATFHISKAAVDGSSYLSALASGKYAERPDKHGAIAVSDITAEHLQAVIEFLEDDEISDVESFAQTRLFKVAQRFGNAAMESYVQDPQKYRAEQLRLARTEGIEGATVIPAGFVRIEAGEFVMGSPASEENRDADEVEHTVHLTRPYLLKQTLVTQAEYQALMGRNPSEHTQGPDAGSRPVENVSWYDAVAYCNALSDKEGLPAYYALHNTPGASHPVVERAEDTGAERSYRLPTEAEWEYAARAGSTHTTYGLHDEIAWFYENAGRTTNPVGQKAASRFGLYDMLGNVWEWTADIYGPLQATVAYDPQGPVAGAYRVLRGGDCFQRREHVRSAHRRYADPCSSDSYQSLGLRPARSDD